jgi:hypothetical protein
LQEEYRFPGKSVKGRSASKNRELEVSEVEQAGMGFCWVLVKSLVQDGVFTKQGMKGKTRF